MDDYSLEEVKNIVKSNKLSAYILRAILDNATRRIEIYNDEECIEILKFILDNVNFEKDVSVKEEIESYLEKLSIVEEKVDVPSSENIENVNDSNSLKTFFVALLSLVIVSVMIVLLNR